MRPATVAAMALFLLVLSAPGSSAQDAPLLPDAPPERMRDPGLRDHSDALASPLQVAGASGDTVWVGHVKLITGLPGTPGGAGPYHIGRGPALPEISDNGIWSWDGEDFRVGENDSLLGWWPIRRPYTVTGGLTLADVDRSWWALDYGNNVNYVLNSRQQNRTFGVNGVWHVDPGNVVTTTVPGTNPVAPGWGPISGSGSAWCGLRGHGDLTAMDAPSQGGYGNPFNADAHMFTMENSLAGGTSKNWPGYASQWDQLLYRDIAVPAGASLSIAFDYATKMSTLATSINATATGWFEWDPRSLAAGNFISATSAGSNRPVDSLMVYIGQPVNVNACMYSDGGVEPVYDLRRRWKSEVLKIGATKEILSVAGERPTTHVAMTFTPADLAPYRDAAGLVRLCFRVKTNRGFDDTNLGYASAGAGAARIDNVVLDHSGAAGVEVASGFESAAEIDNRPEMDGHAVHSWKATGKPPAIYWHLHPLEGGSIGNGNDYAPLVYEDVCGPPNSPNRKCTLGGMVVSAGDHDRNDAAGGEAGTPDREVMDGIVSPAIALVSAGPGQYNEHGIDADIADATDDYYVRYEIYTGVFDNVFEGSTWSHGWQSYPAQQSNGSRAWGEIAWNSTFFSSTQTCFIDLQPARGLGLIQTSNPNGIPDSLRVVLLKRQECFRFGISAGCSSTSGAYFDNVSIGFVDAPTGPAVASAGAVGSLHLGIWDWIQDAFPFNEAPELPGTAGFDTCAAFLKTGLNLAPGATSLTRFVVPADTSVVQAPGSDVRVDLVFRILPGVGNHVTIGDPLSSLRRVPTSPVAALAGDGSFWGTYLASHDGGSGLGSPGGHPGGVWSPDVWNSARCDTAELNLFPIAARGNLPGLQPGVYASMLHEEDPRFAVLGADKQRCFLVDTAGPPGSPNTTCASVPPWISALPASRTGYPGTPMTKEYTKILPDGLLTPGAHVQYFFRKSLVSAPSVFVAAPDTCRIFTADDADGQRFQHVGVLPDRWKEPAYGGSGMACMLVVDNADRRGNESSWVAVADSIGATAPAKWGAHNGWHAPRGYGFAAACEGSDPAIAVWAHGGQAGTTWDLYQVKASEARTVRAGGIGSRLGYQADPGLLAGKLARNGPTPTMLRTYYRLLYLMTGDLGAGVLGPMHGNSMDDVGILQDFALNPAGTPAPRGLFIQGADFVEGETKAADIAPAHGTFVNQWLATSLRASSYNALASGGEGTVDLIASNPIDPNGGIFGVRNGCSEPNDLVSANAGVSGAEAAAFYENLGANGPYVASVVVPASVSHPFVSLVNAFDIDHVVSREGDTTFGRLQLAYLTFSQVFGSLCSIAGTPVGVDDPRVDGGALRDAMRVLGNPVRSGEARIALTLASRARTRVVVHDVAGRAVRTLADRAFEPGEHTLVWDGADDAGRTLPRGVYFVRVRGLDREVEGTQKVVFLR